MINKTFSCNSTLKQTTFEAMHPLIWILFKRNKCIVYLDLLVLYDRIDVSRWLLILPLLATILWKHTTRLVWAAPHTFWTAFVHTHIQTPTPLHTRHNYMDESHSTIDNQIANDETRPISQKYLYKLSMHALWTRYG